MAILRDFQDTRVENSRTCYQKVIKGLVIEMVYLDAIRLFKERLKSVYGDRLVDIILYGSYARGDQDKESDVDLLVLLKDINDFWKEVHLVEDIAYEINDSFNWKVFISAIPEDIEMFKTKKIPLFLNIQREGISV